MLAFCSAPVLLQFGDNVVELVTVEVLNATLETVASILTTTILSANLPAAPQQLLVPLLLHLLRP